MNVTEAYLAAQSQRMRGLFEASQLAAELGCEVTAHPRFPGIVEAREPAPGLWLLTGTPDKVRAWHRAELMRGWLGQLGALKARADRAEQMRGWLAVLGTLQPAGSPRKRPGRKPGTANPGLTAREQEIALLVARGLTDRAIASRLHLSRRTVEAHLRAAYRKAAVPNRAALVSWLIAREQG